MRTRGKGRTGDGGDGGGSRQGARRGKRGGGENHENEEEEEVSQEGAQALNVPSENARRQRKRRGPGGGGDQDDEEEEEEEEGPQQQRRRGNSDDEDAAAAAAAGQGALSRFSSLVSSAMKNVVNLMSPQGNGVGGSNRDLRLSEERRGAGPPSHQQANGDVYPDTAAMNGKRKGKVPQSSSSPPRHTHTHTHQQQQYRATVFPEEGEVDEEDGAIELPASDGEDGYVGVDEYEGQPVDSITVSELKKILRLKGLSYKGKKSELAERLKEWLRGQQGGQQQGQQQPPASSPERGSTTSRSGAVARELASQVGQGLLPPEQLERIRSSASDALNRGRGGGEEEEGEREEEREQQQRRRQPVAGGRCHHLLLLLLQLHGRKKRKKAGTDAP